MTSSPAGVYGNFGQTNYSAAKIGLLGFAKTLALEGSSKNIHVNTIAPVSASRMTENVLPPEVFDKLKPEAISSMVTYLCHESCEETGGLFELGGGWFSALRWQRTQGVFLGMDKASTPEAVRDNWSKINDFTDPVYPSTSGEGIQAVIAHPQSKL